MNVDAIERLLQFDVGGMNLLRSAVENNYQ
jgi:hypothetical protein